MAERDDIPPGPVPDAPDAAGPDDDGGEARARGPRALRVVLITLGSLAGGLVVLVLLFFLALQTNWGGTRFADFLLGLGNPWDGAYTEYDELTGNFISRIEFHNLRITRVDTFLVDTLDTDPLRLDWAPYDSVLADTGSFDAVVFDTVQLAQTDTFRLRYDLLSLLRRRVEFNEVYLADPDLNARQRRDGTWDLIEPFRDTSAVDTTNLFTFAVEHAHVTNGNLTAEFYPPWKDSTLRVQDFNTEIYDLTFTDGVSVLLDTLHTRYMLPGQDDWTRLAAGGTLTDDLLVLDGLRLQSPQSLLTGVGTLRLPSGEDDVIDDIDFRLEARPIAFEDLRLFAPTLNPEATATLDVRVQGTSALVQVTAEGTLGDGARVDVEGHLSPTTDGPLAYALGGEIRQLDPSYLTQPDGGTTLLNADFDLDLQGTNLDALDGTAGVVLFDSRIADVFVDRTSLDAAFEDGLARIDGRVELPRSGPIRVEGTLRPFAEVLTYDLRGRLTNFNVASVLDAAEGETPQRSDISGTFSIEGTGTDPETAEVTATIALAPSSVNDYAVEDGRLELRLVDGDLRFGTRMLFPEGFVAANGNAQFQGETTTYAVTRGRIENVDVAALLGNPAESSFNGNFSLEGRGTDPQTLALTSHFDLFDSYYGTYRVAAADLNVNMQNGLLRTTAEADLVEAGSFALALRTRPFDETPLLQVTDASFRNLDIGALTQNPDQSSDLNGSAAFTVRGFDPATMRLEGRFTLRPSQVNEQAIEGAVVTADLRQGALTFDADVDLPGGAVALAGTARPFDAMPTYRVRRGSFENVDLAAFTGNPSLSSDLDGTLSLSGRGLNPQTLRLEGRFQLDRSRINEQVIESAALSGTWQGGTLGFTLDLDVPEGQTRLSGTAQFRGEVPTYTITDGTFAGLNLGTLTGNPNLTSDLSGNVSLSGRGFDPATLSAEGRIDLNRSRLNEQVIEDAFVEGTWADGRLDFTLGLDVSQGQTRLSGTADLGGEVLTYTVTDGTFAGLNVGALTGNPDWQTDLNGVVEAVEGRGTDPATMQLDARLRFRPSVINDATLSSGRLEASLDDGFLRFDTDLTFPEGGAQAQVAGRFFDEVPTYSAEGSLTNVDVADILGNDTLTARFSLDFDVEGTGFDPRTMRLEGLVRSNEAAYEGGDLDTLFADFLLADGVLVLDSLLLRSTLADVQGQGTLALFDTLGTRTSDFSFIADVRDLAPLRPLFGDANVQLENAHLEGRVYGPPGLLQFDVSGRARSLVYNDIRLADFEGRLAGELGPERTLRLGEARGELAFLSLPQLGIEGADFDVRYEGDDVVFTVNIQVDERRDARLSGRVDLRPDSQRVLVENLSFRFDDDTWQLLQPASVTYGDEYRVSNFLLYADDQQIALDGVVDPDGMQSLVMTVENFRMDAVTDLLGYRGLGGTVDGSIDLTGPAADPNLTGILNLDLVSNDRAVGDLRLGLTYDDLRLNVDALLTHEEGGNLDIDGYIPLDLRLSADTSGVLPGEGLGVAAARAEETGVNLTVTSDSFGIGWIAPFLDPETIDRIEGRLAGQFDIRGTLESPVLDGSASLTNGLIGIPLIGRAYENIQATFELTNNQVVLQNAVMESGGGTMTARGTINLTELTLGEFDIVLTANDFLAIDSEEYEAVVDADLTLQGTTDRPVLGGEIEVKRAEINLTEETTSPELQNVQLTERDLRTLEQRFGIRVTEEDTTTFSFYEALTMDLDVVLERDTWLRSRRNPRMDIQFNGNLDLSKQPHRDVTIYGSIEVVPEHSSISQFGKQFNLTSGTLTFNGPAADPYIDVQAEYDVPARGGTSAEVVITLSVTGSLQENLDVNLGSTPDMPMTDVVSYLATGRPANRSLQLGSAATGLAFDQLASLLEGFAGAELGLDVVEVEQLGLTGTTVLTAGKYVTSQLFVSVSQPISFGNESGGTTGTRKDQGRTIVTIEYEIRNWLLLRLLAGQNLQLNLLWEYAY